MINLVAGGFGFSYLIGTFTHSVSDMLNAMASITSYTGLNGSLNSLTTTHLSTAGGFGSVFFLICHNLRLVLMS